MDARSRLNHMRAVERLATRDATLFSDPVVAADRLGWIGLPQRAADGVAELETFAAKVATSGITDAVLLGMGGSSLAPLVLSRVFGHAAGHPALHVLDTTSPEQVSALLHSLTPATTIVIVSSKSGTTVEPLCLADVVGDWLRAGLGDAVGSHFLAITDPGSPLESEAAERGYAHVFRSPADVGGRYAALTPFGLVPAALSGIDVGRLAAAAVRAEGACRTDDADNPGAALAVWLADAHAAGRDKLTVVVSEPYASFGLWVEQLVAESTGKRGTGLLPVLEPAPGEPAAHGADRMTFVLRSPDDTDLAGLGSQLDPDEPVFEAVLRDPYALAGEFVRWEWAVALFSALRAIEPFDQPNVAEAKAATETILRGAGPGSVPSTITVAGPGVEPGGIEILAPALASLFDRLGPDPYVAVLCYVPDDPALTGPLREACAALAAARRVPVTLEIGPRYLHSTGQYHKGGPSNGLFVIITTGNTDDVRVPGRSYTLGMLNRAQAEGDLATLTAHGRPVLHVTLPGPGRDHLETLAEALRASASGPKPATRSHDL